MPGVAPSKIMPCASLPQRILIGRVLAANGVGRAVEDVGRGDAAGQRAVDGDVLGIEHVPDIDHRGTPTRCLR